MLRPKRILRNLAAVTNRDLLSELNKLHAEAHVPDPIEAATNCLPLLCGENRIWLHTLRKSGTTFTINVLVNYIVEEGIRRSLYPPTFDPLLPHREALDPEVMRAFHTMERKLGRATLVDTLNKQRDVLRPTWNIEALVHTHRNIPSPLFKYILVLTRNPFDYAISSYHFHIKNRGGTEPFSAALEGRLEAFVKHYSIKKKLQKQENCLVMHYEALMRTPKPAFSKVLQFFGREVDEDILQVALHRSSKKAVKKMEEERGAILIGKSDELQVSGFIRSGKIGEWSDTFSKEDERFAVNYLEERGVDLGEFTFS